MAFTRGLLVPLVYYCLSLTLIFFFSELLIPVKLAWLLLMFYEGVCFYNEVFLDKELDFLAAAFSGEPIRAAIEFFVEMPLLAPIVLTRPPKLLPLAFDVILFFKMGVYLPG